MMSQGYRYAFLFPSEVLVKIVGHFRSEAVVLKFRILRRLSLAMVPVPTTRK